MSGFIYHSKASSACPLCKQVSSCRTNSVGGVHCRHTDKYSPPTGYHFGSEDKQGFNVFWPDDARTFGRVIDRQVELAKETEDAAKSRKEREKRQEINEANKDAHLEKTQRMAKHIERDRRAMTDEERTWLAFQLCLPTKAFDVMDIRYIQDLENGRGNAYVIPERGPHGEVVALGLRYHDNSKQTYGGRGLFIPDGWLSPGDDPIIIPEGMSDTLHLFVMGHSTVGRPSNMSGIEMLAKLIKNNGLAASSRPIVIMGEYDERTVDGKKIWPGRDGAERTATRLAEIIGRPVHVAYPPNGYKDVRGFVEAHKVALLEDRPDRKKTFNQLGFTFLEHVLATMKPFGEHAKNESISVIFGYTPEGEVIAPLSALKDMPISITSISAPTVRVDQCPNARGVLLRNVERNQSRNLWADCKRLTCEHCGPIKRLQYQETVRVRLTDWEKESAKNGPPGKLWKFWCNEMDWRSVSNHIRRLDGDFFRTDLPVGNALIISSVEPPAKFLGAAHQISVPEAIDTLCQTIHHMPTLRPKVFTSSSAWKLVNEEKSAISQGWERITAFACSKEQVVNILEYNSVEWEIEGKRGRFWGWTACQWSNAGVDVEHMYDQISVGEPMPKIEFDDFVPSEGGGKQMKSFTTLDW